MVVEGSGYSMFCTCSRTNFCRSFIHAAYMPVYVPRFFRGYSLGYTRLHPCRVLSAHNSCTKKARSLAGLASRFMERKNPRASLPGVWVPFVI